MQSSLRGTFTFMPSHRRNCCSRASRNYSARHFVCVSARARFSSSEISSSSSLNCKRKLIAFLSKSLLAFCPCVYRQCTDFQTDLWPSISNLPSEESPSAHPSFQPSISMAPSLTPSAQPSGEPSFGDLPSEPYATGPPI